MLALSLMATRWSPCRTKSAENSRLRSSYEPIRISLADFGQFDREFRQRRVEIGNEPVVGDLEDRRFLVLVDRDDDLAILHPGEMLDRARDTNGNIEIRRHDLAGLADLPIVRREAGIDCPHGLHPSPRRACRRPARCRS